MTLLFPLHPRFVHFPIALLLSGTAVIFLGMLLHRERWLEYGRFSLILGWLGVLLASLTGLIDEARATASSAVETVVNQHITVGVLLLVVSGLAVYLPLRSRSLSAATPEPGRAQERAWRAAAARRALREQRNQRGQRVLYLALLALGAGLVLLDGWLGGKLVYALGVGVAGR